MSDDSSFLLRDCLDLLFLTHNLVPDGHSLNIAYVADEMSNRIAAECDVKFNWGC